MKINRFFSLGLSIATFTLSSFVSATMGMAFPDIGGRNDRKAIEFLTSQGILNGYTDGTYKPEKSISRAEFTKILLETAQIPLKQCTATEIKNITSLFSDVSPKEWFAPYICTAQKSGIIHGYSDKTFKPNKPINVAESAKIITLAHNLPDIHTIEQNIHKYSNNPQWFTKYIIALRNENAIDPFHIPNENEKLSRGQMADIVWRLITGMEITNTNDPQTISSCTHLEKELTKAQKRQYGAHNLMYYQDNEIDNNLIEIQPFIQKRNDTEIMEATPNTTLFENNSSNDYSQTNIQESGVDEADIVKNDGSHIFIARDHDIRIIKAYPQNEMKEDAVINIDDMSIITDLFLSQNTLVVIGENTLNQSPKNTDPIFYKRNILPPNYTNTHSIEIRIFDVSDKTQPVLKRNISLHGDIISSREINDTLYIVTKQNLYNYTTNKSLPSFSDNGSKSPMVSCNQISYFPNFTSQNLTTIASINIKNNNKKIHFTSFLGAGNTIYMSLHNLYVVQSDTIQKFITHEIPSTPYTPQKTESYWDWQTISRISKFALKTNNVDFIGQTEIPGTVLNQYSMSEFENHFRIATHINRIWKNGEYHSENNITIFDENLHNTGTITGIAPDEQIKSVRFMGNRGFVVTFKNTDPLFVIDMNPTNPKIVGELKIPGWSDYLLPIDDQYLIGFGKEVSEKAINTQRLTWDMIKGMKLSMFDVSDIHHPKEIHKIVIGDRDTTSDILYNPKALFFDAKRKLIGFPIRIYKQIETKNDCKSSIEKCVVSYTTTKNIFTGAHLYSFDIHTGFTLQGAISHFPTYDVKHIDNSYVVKRLVRIKDMMYSISENMIKGLDLHLKVNKEIRFTPHTTCSEIKDISNCMNRSDCEPVFRPNQCDKNGICLKVSVFDKCQSIQ